MRRLRVLVTPLSARATPLVALLAAVVILSTGAWQLQRARTQALQQASEQVRVLAHAMSQHAARTIEAVDLSLEDVVDRAERSGGAMGDLAPFVRQRASRMAQVRNLAVTGADGSWRADALSQRAPTTSADRAYFAFHRDHDGRALHIGEPIASRTTGKMSIPLSRRINAPGGAFGGVVVATLAPEYLAELYKDVRTGKSGSVAMWSEDGRLLLRYPAVRDPAPTATAAFTALFKDRFGVGQAVSGLDGVERLFAFEHLDDLPLIVSASVSVEEALAGWRHDAVLQGAVIGGSTVLLVLLGLGLEMHRRRIAHLLDASRATDRLYRLLADNSSDMITRMALDGTRLYVSPASRDLLGRLPEDLVGSNPVDTVHPDDRAQLRRRLDELSTGARDHAINVNRLRHSEGHWVWVEASLRLLRDEAGEPAGIVAALRNVTERQRAAEALRESEARYRALAETTSDVITQLDIDFRRRYASPSCRQLLGYEPEEMLGARPSAEIHDDDAPATRRLAQRLVAGEIDGDRCVTSYRTRHKDGHWVWVEAALTLVRNEATGVPSSIVCSLRDITERQQAAELLAGAKAAAEAAGRAKSDFVANMSHELRTPLTGVLGVLDLLRRDASLAPEQRRLVTLAADAGASLLSIVNDVLDFSKIEAGAMTVEAVPFDLGELVASCCDLMVESLRDRPVAVRASGLTPGPIRCIGDPTRLRQVLLNLMLNAAKFTERGSIVVRVDHRPEAGQLGVEVTDTGIGIPAGGAEQLFARFEQADSSMTRRFGGTGLGLAICRRLVELMGGTIGARAEPAGGSTFFFAMPLRSAPGRSPDALPTPPRHVGGALLLAEDNATNAEIIAAMLTARGYTVSVVQDGAAAVAAAERHPAPDLVLMDLQMPVMDGLAATAAIRAAEAERGSRRLPIIGLTANALAEDAARCRAGGMDDHVAKPIAWPDLFTAIDRALADATSAARAA